MTFDIEECKRLLLEDRQINEILHIVDGLELPDAWIAAGTVRNAIWNLLSDRPAFDRDTDVDLVFFDLLCSREQVRYIQNHLQETYPDYQWEVKNQAHMHPHSPNTLPYRNTCDAIRKYPEICTAIVMRLKGEELELFTPYGLEDIVNFVVRPTPYFQSNQERLDLYRHRVSAKNWKMKWPQLRVEQGEPHDLQGLFD